MPVLQLQPQGQAPGEDEQYRQMMAAMLASQANQSSGQMQEAQAQQPLPPSSMVASPPPQLPPAPQPPVDLAHATLQDQPATQDVSRAQGNLEKFQHRPFWKTALPIALIGAGAAAGAHTWGGRQLAENAQQDISQLIGTQRGEKESLIKQIEFAKQQQQQQYEADQRNRQQDILMAGNNQTKTLMAQIAAGAKRDVATTGAGAREYAADQGLEGRQYTADQGLEGRKYTADQGRASRLETAKINATAAMNRFLAGQGREDDRQLRSFSHTDTKPTADEDRRADLAEAASGYADMLEDIATRRPELFGPLAGRVTQGKQWLGTTDPDVANLKFLREQLGITQMGAHSLRSSQAIGPIADSLVNSFHNDAATTIAAAQMAKKGLLQFTSGPVRPTVYEPNPQAVPPPRSGRPTNNPTAKPLTGKVNLQPQAGPEVWERDASGKLVQRKPGWSKVDGSR